MADDEDEQVDRDAFEPDTESDEREAGEGAERQVGAGPDRGVDTGDSSDGGDDETGGDDAVETTPVADLDSDERIELGVDLLAHVERDSLSLAEAVDRIETVTTNPGLTREILDTAELRGVIEREGGRLQTRRRGTAVQFEAEVIEREGDYECRRCGASLSTGHFVRFGTGELGPFGPSCVRAVLGRD